MKKEKLSEKFTVQMSSGAHNQHCDVLPNLSFQDVQSDEGGKMHIVGKVYTIPFAYPVKIIENPKQIEMKRCSECPNSYPLNVPFMKDMCIRCYERKNFIHRDEYREALRAEFNLENELNKS